MDNWYDTAASGEVVTLTNWNVMSGAICHAPGESTRWKNFNSSDHIYFKSNGTQTFKFTLADDDSAIYGGSDTTDDLVIIANDNVSQATISLMGSADADDGKIQLAVPSDKYILFLEESTPIFKFSGNSAGSYLLGNNQTTGDLHIRCNQIDLVPRIIMTNDDDIILDTADDILIKRDNTPVLKIDYEPGSPNITNIYGTDTAGDRLELEANTDDPYPKINLVGAGKISLQSHHDTEIYNQGAEIFKFSGMTGISRLYGGDETTDQLNIYPNSIDAYPYINMIGLGNVNVYLKSGLASAPKFQIRDDNNALFQFYHSKGNDDVVFRGSDIGGGDLYIYANASDTYSYIRLDGQSAGGGGIWFQPSTNKPVYISPGGNEGFTFQTGTAVTMAPGIRYQDTTAGAIGQVWMSGTSTHARLYMASGDSKQWRKLLVTGEGGGTGVSNLSDLTIDTNKGWLSYGITGMSFLSSQTISGGTIKAYTFSSTQGGGIDAHYISANNFNIKLSDLEIDTDKAWASKDITAISDLKAENVYATATVSSQWVRVVKPSLPIVDIKNTNDTSYGMLRFVHPFFNSYIWNYDYGDHQDLILAAGDTIDSLYIKSGSLPYVGIGYHDPQYTLHVSGGTYSESISSQTISGGVIKSREINYDNINKQLVIKNGGTQTFLLSGGTHSTFAGNSTIARNLTILANTNDNLSKITFIGGGNIKYYAAEHELYDEDSNPVFQFDIDSSDTTSRILSDDYPIKIQAHGENPNSYITFESEVGQGPLSIFKMSSDAGFGNTYVRGNEAGTGSDLFIYANQTVDTPYICLYGNDKIELFPEVLYLSSQSISANTITNPNWTTLTAGAGSNADSLHTHTGAASAPGGSMTANVGSDFSFGISGLNFISSQKISSGAYKHYRAQADYIIFKDGDTYYAKDCSDGSIATRNTDAHTVLDYANDQLTGGGKIYVKSGIYTLSQDLRINSHIWLQGEGDSTVFGGQGGYIGVRDQSNVILSDFRVTGNHGVIVRTAGGQPPISGITLRNIEVTLTSGATGDDGGNAGITVYPGHTLGVIEDLKLINCTAYYCEMTGILFDTDKYSDGIVRNLYMEGCRAIRCGHEGSASWSTGINYAEKITLENAIITNCYVSGSYESGFHTEARAIKKNVLIKDCISIYNGRKDAASYGAGFLLDTGVTIDGCSAVGNGPHYNMAMNSGGTILNCILDGWKGGSRYTWSGIAQMAVASEPIIVKNTIIKDHRGHGIRMYRHSAATIQNNNIYDNDKRGISDGAGGGWGRSIVSDNYLHNLGSHGIILKGDSHVIKDNVLRAINGWGIGIYNNNSRVIDNVISGTTNDAIWINSAGTNNLIIDNVIQGVPTNREPIDDDGTGSIIYNNYIDGVIKNQSAVESISSQLLSSNTIRFNKFIGDTGATASELEELTDGSTTTLHSHAGAASAPGGSFTANIGSDFSFGISGVAFVSSQLISGGKITTLHMPYEYIIYTDSNKNYYARKGIDGELKYRRESQPSSAHLLISDVMTDTGSGRVYVASGTYTMSGIAQVESNIWLEGSGIGGTVFHTPSGGLKVSDESNVKLTDFSVSGHYGIRFTTSADVAHGLHVENVKVATVSGAKNLNYAGGFTFYCAKTYYDVKFINCEADNCNGHGFVLYGPKSVLGLDNALFENCRAIRCGLYGTSCWTCGFHISEDPHTKNVTFLNCFASGNLECGWESEAVVHMENTRIINCVANYNGVWKRNNPDYYRACDIGGGVLNPKTLFGAGFFMQGDAERPDRPLIMDNCTAIGNELFGIRVMSGARISNCFIDGLWYASGEGIRAAGAGGGKYELYNNTIKRHQGDGIWLYRSSSSRIIGNEVYYVSGHGIHDSSDWWGRAIVSENRIGHVSGLGINWRGDHSVINNNHVIDVTSDAIRGFDDTVINGNYISGAKIGIRGYVSTIITDNKITDTTSVGIQNQLLPGSLGVYKNIVTNNFLRNTSGIFGIGSDATVQNNYIENTTGDAITTRSNTNHSNISFNIISGVSDDGLFIQGDQSLVMGNILYGVSDEVINDDGTNNVLINNYYDDQLHTQYEYPSVSAQVLKASTHISAQTGVYAHFISANNSNLTGVGGGIDNVVEDTTPQLGGHLDAQDTYGIHDLVSLSSQKISSGAYKHYQAAADYIVFKDGSNFFAKRCSDGAIVSENTDAHTVLDFANDALAGNGGHIYVKSGMYKINTNHLRLNSGVWLQGEGRSTIFGCNDKYIGSLNANNVRFSDFRITGTAGLYHETNDADYSGIRVDNVEVHIVSSQNGLMARNGGFCIYTADGYTTSYVTYTNCYADHCGLHGWYMQGANYDKGRLNNLIMHGCRAIGCGHQGSWSAGIDYGEKVRTTNAIISDCIASGNHNSGFACEGTPRHDNIKIVNCIAAYNGQGHPRNNDVHAYGFTCVGNTIIEGCHSIGNRVGIVPQRSGGVIVNNVIDGKNLTHFWPAASGMYDNAKKCIIKGNTIQNVDGCAIKSIKGSSNIIEGNTIRNAGNGGLWMTIDDSINVKVLNNHFIDVRGYPIYIRGYNAEVNGNLIKNGDGSTDSIICWNWARIGNNRLDKTGRVLIRPNTIFHDNYIYSSQGDAVETNAQSPHNSIIKDNYIENTVGIAIDLQATEVSVKGNYIISSTGVGIQSLSAGKGYTITDNVIKGAGNAGMTVYGGPLVNGNYVFNCKADGMNLIGANAVVTNNKCNHNTVYGLENFCSYSTIANNQFYDDIIPVVQTHGIREATTAHHNMYYNNYLSGSTLGATLQGKSQVLRNNVGYVSENSGWANVANEGTFAHGCVKKPTSVYVTPSGASPIIYSFKVTDANIQIFHSDAGNYDFSWRAEV